MKKEIWKIIKTKRFLAITLILLVCFFEAGIYYWFLGPIGIFREWNGVYEIIEQFGSYFSILTYTKQEAYKLFLTNYGTCKDATAQLARVFVDNLGANFFIFSFLIGAFLMPGREKADFQNTKKIHPKTVCKRYIAAVICTMIFLAILTFLPFCLSFRMKNIGLTGSPWRFWQYLFTWIFPTVIILYAMHVLIGVISESWTVTVFVHFIIMLVMISPTAESYPFYKFIIRFDGCSEDFYLSMKNQIAVNRIFISVLAVILLGMAIWLVKRKREKQL